MWKDASTLAGGLERADDVQEVGVVALLGGWNAIGFEALEGIVLGMEAGGPALVAEGWVGGGVVEGLELVAIEEQRAGEGVALLDLRRGAVVEDHVHAGETDGGGVLFLAVEGDAHAFPVESGVGELQQQRGGTASGIVSGGVRPDVRLVDAEDEREDQADFRRGEELALTLAALGGEVAHEVFVGVAEQVVAIGAVLGEVEGWVLEDGDQVGEAIHHFLAAAEFV